MNIDDNNFEFNQYLNVALLDYDLVIEETLDNYDNVYYDYYGEINDDVLCLTSLFEEKHYEDTKRILS